MVLGQRGEWLVAFSCVFVELCSIVFWDAAPPQPNYRSRLICLSVCRLSVHSCRLGIQRKIAQAQQIRSNFLQNHEST